jgi:hypothetical protein
MKVIVNKSKLLYPRLSNLVSSLISFKFEVSSSRLCEEINSWVSLGSNF